jgi:hypothetical protein
MGRVSSHPPASRAPTNGRDASALERCGRDEPELDGRDEPELERNGRNETELERWDRNLLELMGELRVALPGVQVLFAFLLVAPFNQRFGSASQFERALYFATLLLTTLSSILLIAPTVMHRICFRQGQKPYLVRMSNRLTIAGLGVLAAAMTSAVGLVTHYLFGEAASIIAATIVLAAFGLLWFTVPLAHLRRDS